MIIRIFVYARQLYTWVVRTCSFEFKIRYSNNTRNPPYRSCITTLRRNRARFRLILSKATHNANECFRGVHVFGPRIYKFPSYPDDYLDDFYCYNYYYHYYGYYSRNNLPNVTFVPMTMLLVNYYYRYIVYERVCARCIVTYDIMWRVCLYNNVVIITLLYAQVQLHNVICAYRYNRKQIGFTLMMAKFSTGASRLMNQKANRYICMCV